MAPVPFHPYIHPGHQPARVRVAALPQPHSTPWHGLLIPLLLALALFALAGAAQAQIAISSTGAVPTTPNAMLEIITNNTLKQGMLAPRMTFAQRNLIVSPPDGLLIYQTNDYTTNVKGYYYYDSQTAIVGWRHIADGGRIWLLGGNAGTGATDFVGTLNNFPLIFRVRDFERGRLTTDGKLQFYFNLPYAITSSEMVHVEGAVKLNGGSATPDQEGTIKYIPGTVTSPGQFQGYVSNTVAPVDPTLNGWMQIDNNFGERKNQETADAAAGCEDPTFTTPVPNSVVGAPTPAARPWPIPGPAGPYGQLTGAASPYFTYWEDSRRQYLFQANDLAAAGICAGVGNPIRAIAFSVSSYGRTGPGKIHFLRFRLKNTAAVAIAGFDNNPSGWTTFAQPNPPAAGVPPTYIPRGSGGFHTDGFQVSLGWNVHYYNEGVAPYDASVGFPWNGGNLLIDAASDNQEWTGPTLQEGNVASYNTTYASMISTYCDACGGPIGNNNNNTCLWQPTGGGYYFPPTTPDNGLPGPPGGNTEGWGWVGGWNMTNNTNTNTCDGTYGYNGGGNPSISQRLPRVAFLAKYVGGGIAFKVGNYMFADEGLMVGDATWAGTGAFKGPGTLNAQRSVWSGGTLLNDYVFDLYYDGQARPEDASTASRYMRTPLRELPNYVERERRLPTIDGREQWNKQGNFSVDKLGNQLWITVEDQALYIQELNARMDALKQYLVEKKLKELEAE